MTDTLTTLIGKVQALLLDSGTNYTTATCTAAIRQALKEFNEVAPINAGTLIDVVSGQLEYELESPDFAGLQNVQAVRLKDPSGGESDIDLDHYDYFVDNRPFIRLYEAQVSGQLDISFTLPQTIQGLDDATESTIPAEFDQTMANGGAFYAIAIRSTGRVEKINLNNDVSPELRQSAGIYLAAFARGLAKAGMRKSRPPKLDLTWNYDPKGF